MAGRIDMTQGPLLGVLLRVAAPITAANLAQSVHQLINAWWVGRLGADAIAAVAASGPLFQLLLSLGSGLSTAGAVLVAQNIGAAKREAADHVAAQTLLTVVVVGAAFALAGYFLAPATLRLIGVEAHVFDLTWRYLSVTYVGLVPMFAFLALQAMLQSAGEVRFAMRVMVAAVVLNAVLDPLLIFVVGWGVAGAATATVVAQTLAFLALLHHMLTGRSALHMKLPEFRPDWGHIRLALGLGLPASIEQGARTFGSLLLMSLSAHFGTVGLAAYGIGTRLLFFWFVPMMGLSIATSAVVGQNIGAGQTARAEHGARVAGWLAFAGFSAVGLLLIPVAAPLMRTLAPHQPDVVREATVFCYIFAPFLGLLALPQVLNGVFRGAGNPRQAMTISLLMQYAFQMPAAWFLALATPLAVRGVWWSYPIANVAATILALAWLLKGPWRRNLVERAPAAASSDERGDQLVAVGDEERQPDGARP